ncbi:type II secretion system F family protein [Planctomycetaceae bacterium SH139]
MKHYSYEAIDAAGNSIKANCEADSRREALTLIKAIDLRPTKLYETGIARSKTQKISRAAITRFYAMLGSQLEVNVPLLSAINLIQKQEASGEVKRIFRSIAQQVEAGKSLSEALSRQGGSFTEIDLNLIRAGEEGGFLAESLVRITQMREWQQKLSASVWSAAAYPLVLICVASLLVPGVLVYLVPKLEPIFNSLRRDEQLPWATSVLLTTSHYAQQYGIVTLIAIFMLILAAGWLMPAHLWIPIRDRWLLRVPVVGDVIRNFTLARFCRVMGTLLQNRIQVITSLQIATNVVGNRCLADALRTAQQDVAAGKLLADALNRSEQIPADAVAMLSVAENSNTLDVVLLKIAQQLEMRTNARLETAVKLIEPILLLLMAAFVGFVVLALLLPIFEGQSLG